MSDEGKLNEKEIEELLLKEAVGCLALAKDNRPYIIPLNYAYCDEVIYFHCAPEGRKINYIRANPRACFHVSHTGGLIKGDNPCSHNFSYRSVIIEGIVEDVPGSEAKEAALRKITAKYAGTKMAEAPISSKRIDSVAVYRLIPESISGKRDS